MQTFVHVGRPARGVFGVDTAARLRDEVVVLGVRRALVLSTPNRGPDAGVLAAALGDRTPGVFAGATMPARGAVIEWRMVELDRSRSSHLE